jgi:hypothetical protein
MFDFPQETVQEIEQDCWTLWKTFSSRRKKKFLTLREEASKIGNRSYRNTWLSFREECLNRTPLTKTQALALLSQQSQKPCKSNLYVEMQPEKWSRYLVQEGLLSHLGSIYYKDQNGFYFVFREGSFLEISPEKLRISKIFEYSLRRGYKKRPLFLTTEEEELWDLLYRVVYPRETNETECDFD